MPRPRAQRCMHFVACAGCGGCPSYTEVTRHSFVVLCGSCALVLLSVRERGIDAAAARAEATR